MEKGPGTRAGRGLFAKQLCAGLPLLPVAEEGPLHDPRLRGNFVERVFACGRLKTLLTGRLRPAPLVNFHARHKLLVLAHTPKKYADLGRIVSEVVTVDPKRLTDEYGAAFMAALEVLPNRVCHANVLHHMAVPFRIAFSLRLANASGNLP